MAPLQAWEWRFNPFGEDIISYLDLGDYIWKGDFINGTNSYWSPLYAILLSLMLHVVPHSQTIELPLIKCLNFALFLIILAVSSFFLLTLQKHLTRQSERAPQYLQTAAQLPSLIALDSTFLYSFLFLGGTHVDTPEICV